MDHGESADEPEHGYAIMKALRVSAGSPCDPARSTLRSHAWSALASWRRFKPATIAGGRTDRPRPALRASRQT